MLKGRVKELDCELNAIKFQTKDSPASIKRLEPFICQSSASAEDNKEENILGLLDKLKEEVSFQENKIPQMLRTNPENVRYTMLEELNDITGEFGSLRIKILKKAFWMFLENILPNCSKYGVALFNNNNGISGWIKSVKSMKKRQRKCYSKNNPSKRTILDTISEYEFSNEVLDVWISTGKDFKNKFTALKKCIHLLVKTRNQIFKVLKDLRELGDTSGISMIHGKDDYSKIAEVSQRLGNIDQIKVLNLWGIKRKAENKEL
jgi:hypothetical protein